MCLTVRRRRAVLSLIVYRMVSNMIGLFAMAAAAATGAPPTVFGLEFGKPPSIPLCKHKVLPDGSESITYEQDPAVTCYEPDTELRDAPWRRSFIDFPMRKAPVIMDANVLDAWIIDGKVEGLEIETLNHNHTSAIASELATKFGKPTTVERDRSEVEGIAFPSLVYTWRLHGLTVTYTNIGDGLDHGKVEIDTPVMERVKRAFTANRTKEMTPL